MYEIALFGILSAVFFWLGRRLEFRRTNAESTAQLADQFITSALVADVKSLCVLRALSVKDYKLVSGLLNSQIEDTAQTLAAFSRNDPTAALLRNRDVVLDHIEKLRNFSKESGASEAELEELRAAVASDSPSLGDALSEIERHFERVSP